MSYILISKYKESK